MQVWQTDVQIHFYFTSTIFVWVIHVELINSGGQKTQVSSGTQLLSTGKNPPACMGREKKETLKQGVDCVTAAIELQDREQEKPSTTAWGQIMI